MQFIPAIALFDIRDWVIVVTGSAVDITNPLATILAQAGAHVYVCQPFLSDNDVPGDLEYPGQTFVNMDEGNKPSIANAARIIGSRENHVNLLINVNSEGSSMGRRTSWDSFFNKQQPHFLDAAAQETHEVEDWDRVFGTNISSSYFIASAFSHMLRSGAEFHGRGCVVNISRPGKAPSGALGGYTLPPTFGSSLGRPNVSDTALQQLNTLLSNELNSSTARSSRIRVNAVVLRQTTGTKQTAALTIRPPAFVEQQTHDASPIFNGRPAGRTGLEVQLFHPVFHRFLQSLEATDELAASEYKIIQDLAYNAQGIYLTDEARWITLVDNFIV